ncbi:MAG: 3-deoxy-D-manno-octulosonic acid transferase [Campylobacter sp.]|nr:3-deoxy-D-manno-octulosonic acid transferase [Campylobacter sp.]
MIYTLFTFIIWFLSLPFVLVLSLKSKYKKSLPARFLLFKNPKLKRVDIHFHACSYGEVVALEKLSSNFSSKSFTVTIGTGYEKASMLTQNTRFLPFENFIPFWLNSSNVLVVFEAELWLNLVRTAKKNGSFVVLLNARISDKSYKNYLKFRAYYKEVFKNIDLVLAQSKLDEERLKELGAKNIKVVGNIKSANFKKPTKIYPKFYEKFVVIASTHEKEEKMILSAINPSKNTKYLVAPRHPERFVEAGKICLNFAQKHGLSFEKFSQNLGLNSDVILLDTLNELVNFYAIADVVILGGSFVDGIGGHNPTEVAQFNTPLINGKFYHNQKALFELVEGVKFSDLSDINELLLNELKSTSIKSKCDLDIILNLLKEKSEK